MTGSKATLKTEFNMYHITPKIQSDYMKIMCGVPQGSILGPLLFILYINDIVKVSTVLNPVLFADDTSLFHAHTDFDTLIKEINEELQKITTWFHTNKLSLNKKK